MLFPNQNQRDRTQDRNPGPQCQVVHFYTHPSPCKSGVVRTCSASFVNWVSLGKLFSNIPCTVKVISRIQFCEVWYFLDPSIHPNCASADFITTATSHCILLWSWQTRVNIHSGFATSTCKYGVFWDLLKQWCRLGGHSLRFLVLETKQQKSLGVSAFQKDSY